MKETGYTLIELVTVIMLVSILAAAFFRSPTFSGDIAAVQAGRDDLVAALFYGQQIAMARDSATNPIRLVTTANSVSVTENSIPLLSGSVQYPLAVSSGVQITPAVTLNFDKLGRTTATTFTISKNGASATVLVSDSGYAN